MKTFEEYGLYGMAAVTVIATMNPKQNWAHNVFALGEDVLRAQLDTAFEGVGVDAAKSGMLGSEYAVALTAEYIEKFAVSSYVLDPVMVCKGADEALNPELNEAMAKKLLPLARVVTPNLFEAGQLAGVSAPASIDAMKKAAKAIFDKGAKNVFIKGGSKLHSADSSVKNSVDLLFDGKNFTLFESELLETAWTHGAGCTISAAIAAGLAQGKSVPEAVKTAKEFIAKSLNASFALNKWVGPGNPSAWRKDRLFS
ncbi:MAG: bifunctional hydroxymethylpyrimidine kinase/phosphomethylpyrimidine kinase [Treponemataceae bacterium]|nr:MAG: bifunctional hydroxymethylpyrimidine kinase/phosphomethylpyrimidine kinase [Treponemataceae bacterium]